MSKRVSLYGQVEQSLADRIYSGHYEYGASLPSANALIEEYGVSMTTVRAALIRLRANGLIRLTQGKTAVVTFDGCDAPSLAKYAAWLAQRAESIRDVYAMHCRVVPDYAMFSIRQEDASLADDLCQIWRAASASSSLKALLDALYGFMARLMRGCRNGIMLSLFDAIDEFIRVPVLMSTNENEVRRGFFDHAAAVMERIIGMVRAGDAQGVHDLVYKGYTTLSGLFIQYAARLTGGVRPERTVRFAWALRPENNFLYSVIANDVVIRICCGEYAEDALLPSEAELRDAYDASTITVRRSVKLLCEWGMARTRQGKGTFVLAAPTEIPEGDANHEKLYGSMNEYACLLQAFAVCVPSLARVTVPALDQKTVAAFAARARDALDTNAASLSVAALINLLVRNTPGESARAVFIQLLAEMCLRSRYKGVYAARYPELFARSDEGMRRAIAALENGDADAVAAHTRDALFAVYEAIRRARPDVDAPVPHNG